MVGRSATEAFHRTLHTTLRQTISEETRELTRLFANTEAEDYESLRSALNSAREASEKLRVAQETKAGLNDPPLPGRHQGRPPLPPTRC